MRRICGRRTCHWFGEERGGELRRIDGDKHVLVLNLKVRERKN